MKEKFPLRGTCFDWCPFDAAPAKVFTFDALSMKDAANEAARGQTCVRYKGSNMPFYNKIYRVKDGETIPGTFLEAFFRNGHYFLRPLKIYKDGLIDIGDFRPMDIDGFREKVRGGIVVPYPPENSRVSLGASSLYFNAVNVKSLAEPEDLIKEVEDEIKFLNGQPTSSQVCVEALKAYKSEANAENKEDLRIAYESVPKHRRRFLGDMDSKDWEYKEALKEN